MILFVYTRYLEQLCIVHFKIHFFRGALKDIYVFQIKIPLNFGKHFIILEYFFKINQFLTQNLCFQFILNIFFLTYYRYVWIISSTLIKIWWTMHNICGSRNSNFINVWWNTDNNVFLIQNWFISNEFLTTFVYF